jgi:hypothetical protein
MYLYEYLSSDGEIMDCILDNKCLFPQMDFRFFAT